MRLDDLVQKAGVKTSKPNQKKKRPRPWMNKEESKDDSKHMGDNELLESRCQNTGQKTGQNTGQITTNLTGQNTGHASLREEAASSLTGQVTCNITEHVTPNITGQNTGQNTGHEFQINLLNENQTKILTTVYKMLEAGKQKTMKTRASFISKGAGVNIETTRRILKTFVKKGILDVIEIKKGQNGYIVYKIPPHIIGQITGQITGQVTYNKTDQMPPSSSSSYLALEKREENNFTQTTTTDSTDYTVIDSVDIPNELKEYISKAHIRQLIRFGIDNAQLIQKSLDNLSWNILAGAKYRSITAVFMAVMKKEGFIENVDNISFCREKALKLMESEKQEQAKLTESIIEQENRNLTNDLPDGGLDTIPF